LKVRVGIRIFITGFVLLSVVVFPLALVIADGVSLKDVLNFPHEMERFFGTWPAVWLLLGFMVCVPLLGAYLIVESAVSLRKAMQCRRTLRLQKMLELNIQ